MLYKKGTHIIATLTCSNSNLINTYQEFNDFIMPVIEASGLNNLGTVFHNFTPLGFTSVICLSESHLSIHTWPEFSTINIDVYLSSVTKDNSDTCHVLFDKITQFFNAQITQKQVIER